MSKYTFNIDRWEFYTAQRLHAAGIHGKEAKSKMAWMAFWDDYPVMTPRQIRRCIKKARHNEDWSIGGQP